MDTFRYKIIKTSTELSEAKLNEFGRRGFELVSVDSDEYGHRYYFKVKVENNG